MTGRREISPNRLLELEILAAKLEEEGWLPTVAHALMQEKLIKRDYGGTSSIQAFKLAELASESAATWLITCEELRSDFSTSFHVEKMVNQYRRLISL